MWPEKKRNAITSGVPKIYDTAPAATPLKTLKLSILHFLLWWSKGSGGVAQCAGQKTIFRVGSLLSQCESQGLKSSGPPGAATRVLTLWAISPTLSTPFIVCLFVFFLGPVSLCSPGKLITHCAYEIDPHTWQVPSNQGHNETLSQNTVRQQEEKYYKGNYQNQRSLLTQIKKSQSEEQELN